MFPRVDRSAEEVQRRANFNRNLVDRILHSVYDVLCTHTGSRAHRRQLAQLHDGVNELKLPLNTFARRNRSWLLRLSSRRHSDCFGLLWTCIWLFFIGRSDDDELHTSMITRTLGKHKRRTNRGHAWLHSTKTSIERSGQSTNLRSEQEWEKNNGGKSVQGCLYYDQSWWSGSSISWSRARSSILSLLRRSNSACFAAVSRYTGANSFSSLNWILMIFKARSDF